MPIQLAGKFLKQLGAETAQNVDTLMTDPVEGFTNIGSSFLPGRGGMMYSAAKEAVKASPSSFDDPYGGAAGIITSALPGGIIPSAADSILKGVTRKLTGRPQGLFAGMSIMPRSLAGGRSVMSYYPY